MPYCPNCGNELDEASAFCSDCGHEREAPAEIQSSNSEAQKNIKEPSGGWWVGVLLPTLSIIIPIFFTFLAGIFAGFTGQNGVVGVSQVLTWILYIGTGASVVISPIAFHLDKQYVESASGWEPSDIYYLLFVPLLNAVLALGYINQRHDALKGD
jgi:hypothetical protein